MVNKKIFLEGGKNMPGGSGSWLDFQRMYYIGGHTPFEQREEELKKKQQEEDDIANLLSRNNHSSPPKDKNDDDPKWPNRNRVAWYQATLFLFLKIWYNMGVIKSKKHNMKNLIALMILAVVVFSGYIFVKKDFFSNNPVLEKNASPEIVDMSFLTKPMFLEDSFKNKQNLDHTVVVSTTKATTTTAIRTTTTKNNYTNNFEEVPQPSGIRYATYKSNKHRFEFLYNASLVIEEEDYEMAENARASIIVITTPEFVEFAKDFSGISTTEMALSLPLVEIPGAVINIWPSENGNFETYLSDVYKSDYWNRENIVNKNNIHFAKFTQKSQEEDVDSMLEREGIDYDSLDPDEKKMVDFWLSMEAAKKREFVVNFNQKIITISITGEESAKDGFVSNWKFN